MAEKYTDRDTATKAAEKLQIIADADLKYVLLDKQYKALEAIALAEETAARDAAAKNIAARYTTVPPTAEPAKPAATPSRPPTPVPAAPKVTTSPRPPAVAPVAPPHSAPPVAPPAPAATAARTPASAAPAPEAPPTEQPFKHGVGDPVLITDAHGNHLVHPGSVTVARRERRDGVNYYQVNGSNTFFPEKQVVEAPPSAGRLDRVQVADSDEARAARPLFTHGAEVFLRMDDGTVSPDPLTIGETAIDTAGNVDYTLDGDASLRGDTFAEADLLSPAQAVRYFSRRRAVPPAPAATPHAAPGGPGLTHDPDAHPPVAPPPPGGRKGMWGAFKDLLSESWQTTKDLASGGASGGAAFLKGAWETLKSTPKVIFSRQLWETIGGAAGSILGVRSPVVIYKFIKDRYRMSAEKSELASLIKDGVESFIAARRLGVEDTELEQKEGRDLMVRAERVKMRIDAHPKMSAELKTKTKDRVDTVIREHVGQTTFHKEKFNADINKILDDFIEARVSGYDVAKEVLNTGFVLTGLMTFRGISYATLAAAERANKFSRNYEREHRDELASGWAKAKAEGATLKDLVWGSLKETGRIFTGRAAKAEDDDDKAQVKRDRFRALGNILRFAGIGASTYADPEHFSLSIDKALEAMQKNGVAGALVNNFEENAVRMVNALKSLPDLPSNVENWVEKNLHVGHGNAADAAAAAAAAPGASGAGAIARAGAPSVSGGAPGVVDSAPLPRGAGSVVPPGKPAGGLGAPAATGPVLGGPHAGTGAPTPDVPAAPAGTGGLLDSIHATMQGKGFIVPLENGGDDLYGKLRALIMDSLDKNELSGGRLTSLGAGRFLNVEENIITKLLHGHSAGGVSAETFDRIVGYDGDNLVIRDYAAFKSAVMSPLWANATKTVTEAATEAGDSTAVGYVDSVSQKQWQHLVDLKTGSGVVVDDFGHDKLVHDAELHDPAARSPFVKDVRDSSGAPASPAPSPDGSGRVSQEDLATMRRDALTDKAALERINAGRIGASKGLGAATAGDGRMSKADVDMLRHDTDTTAALIKRARALRDAGGESAGAVGGAPAAADRGAPGASSGAPIPRGGEAATAIVEKAVTADALKKLAKATETFVSGDTSTTDALYSETLGWEEKVRRVASAIKDRSEDMWYKFSNDNGPVSFMKHGSSIIMKNSGLDGGAPMLLNEKTIRDSMKFKEAIDSTV